MGSLNGKTFIFDLMLFNRCLKYNVCSPLPTSNKKGIYLVRLNCITVLLCFSFEIDVGHGHSFKKEMEVRILSLVYLLQMMD